MRKLLLAWLLSALVVPALAQFGSNTARRINSGTAAPPATCSSSPVDAYVRTGATLPGLYLCQSANTWSAPLSTSGGTFTGDVYFKSGRPWIDALAIGFLCDGTTDDTGAMTNALQALYDQGGGTLMIPAGKVCLIAGQVTIPNNGAGTPSTKPMRITSWGNPSMASAAAGIISPNGGGTLNMTFNSATGKIDDRSVGYLEIDHVILEDTASDCAAFIFDTNGVLHIHDTEFYGTATGTSACNDAIVLGGT